MRGNMERKIRLSSALEASERATAVLSKLFPRLRLLRSYRIDNMIKNVLHAVHPV